MRNPPVDLYWSFRSPYSYLATTGALEIAQNYHVDVRLKPVLPLAIRQPDFFSEDNIKRAKYIILDWQRRAEMLDMPHVWPSPDPIVQDMKTFSISDEQPYIYRLTCLGVEAERRGRGLEFVAEVSRLIFGGTRDWHLGNHMASAAERAGLDLTDMEKAIQEPKSHIEEIDANQKYLEEAGHWGVPTFVFNDEPFFGQDRIDTLCWRLRKHNLQRR